MPAQRYKWLFFDLDGTLWDFNSNSEYTLQLLIRQLTPALVDHEAEFLAAYRHYNDFLWIEYGEGRISKEELRWKRFYEVFRQFGLDNRQLAVEFGEKYISMSPYQTRVVEHTFEVLDYLKQKEYHLYLLTNGFTEIQHIKTTQSGLAPYFEKVFTSDESGYKKPHKSAFDYAVKCVNARKRESLMIGDEWPIDIFGARQAGIDQVYFNTRNQPAGCPVTYEIRSLLELKQIL